MPIKPRPFTFVCVECGWKKTVAPQSDALGPGGWFEKCPKCGNGGLKREVAGWVSRTLAELFTRRL